MEEPSAHSVADWRQTQPGLTSQRGNSGDVPATARERSERRGPTRGLRRRERRAKRARPASSFADLTEGVTDRGPQPARGRGREVGDDPGAGPVELLERHDDPGLAFSAGLAVVAQRD